MFDDLLAELDAVPAAAVQSVVDRFNEVANTIAGGAGMGWIGAALHTEPVDLAVAAGTATVTVAGVPAGLWVWVETGTKPHMIAPRHAGRNNRRPAMTLPKHPVGVAVHHPGTRGHHLWTTTVDQVDLALEELILSAIDVSVP